MKHPLLQILRALGRLWCRLQGAEVHHTALIHGFPRITRKDGGRIILEEGATLNVATWSNPLNDNRGMRIHAAKGALIRFAAHSGASSSRMIAHSGIEIGAGTLIGAGSLLCDSDMHEVPLGCGGTAKTAPIKIGRHVFIGTNCTILKGVSIGDAAVIGANSLVNRDIPPGVLAAGNPARVIRNFAER